MAPFGITIFGAGNVGMALAGALAANLRLDVRLVDRSEQAIDAARAAGIAATLAVTPHLEQMKAAASGRNMIVAAVPDRSVASIATLAADIGAHYLDFCHPSPDTAAQLNRIAAGHSVLAGCGASPGLVENVMAGLLSDFASVEDLTVRVGAIPRFPTNRLGYGRIWNIDGLFDEYLLPSAGLRDGKPVALTSLEGYERLSFDGAAYEAFITAGGLGDLSGLPGNLQNLTFKTIRHPGHLDYMRLLLDDFGLKQRRDILKMLLSNGLPAVKDDIVLFFLTARGYVDRQLVERSVLHRLAPTFQAERFNALTRVASGYAATLINMLIDGALPQKGLIDHRKLATADILKSPFLAGQD